MCLQVNELLVKTLVEAKFGDSSCARMSASLSNPRTQEASNAEPRFGRQSAQGQIRTTRANVHQESSVEDGVTPGAPLIAMIKHDPGVFRDLLMRQTYAQRRVNVFTIERISNRKHEPSRNSPQSLAINVNETARMEDTNSRHNECSLLLFGPSLRMCLSAAIVYPLTASPSPSRGWVMPWTRTTLPIWPNSRRAASGDSAVVSLLTMRRMNQEVQMQKTSPACPRWRCFLESVWQIAHL